MKKLIALFIMIVLIASLTACAPAGTETDGADNTITNTSATPQDEVSKTEDTETSKQGIEVDKNLTNVEITLPASFFVDQTTDAVIASAAENGITASPNDDGSYTYKMPKARHKELLNETGEEIYVSIGDIMSEKTYESVKDIECNDNFTEFNVSVEKEKFENSFDSMVAVQLGIQASIYHSFDGDSNRQTTINFKDSATGEVINTQVYPTE